MMKLLNFHHKLCPRISYHQPKLVKLQKFYKAKASEGSKLEEDVKSRKPSKKEKSMNITPQFIFPDAHDESDEAPNSSLKGNINPVSSPGSPKCKVHSDKENEKEVEKDENLNKDPNFPYKPLSSSRSDPHDSEKEIARGFNSPLG